MNYIIWKNINSNTFSGLLISELPTISKPNMRIQETVIDGVDGSLIEELGYESYDKTIKIGLYGNFDINSIINYFNGEGNVIFSNEPDKYYVAKIIQKIDYEKLLRFKTATITFRVQPYKYKYQESSQIFNNPSTNITVVNAGLIESKPLIKLTGTGTIEFKIANTAIFNYKFPTGETEVVIDSEKQDAYLGTALKNRNMTGEFPILKSGNNIITWTGSLTKIEVLAKSRWL